MAQLVSGSDIFPFFHRESFACKSCKWKESLTTPSWPLSALTSCWSPPHKPKCFTESHEDLGLHDSQRAATESQEDPTWSSWLSCQCVAAEVGHEDPTWFSWPIDEYEMTTSTASKKPSLQQKGAEWEGGKVPERKGGHTKCKTKCHQFGAKCHQCNLYPVGEI